MKYVEVTAASKKVAIISYSTDTSAPKTCVLVSLLNNNGKICRVKYRDFTFEVSTKEVLGYVNKPVKNVGGSKVGKGELVKYFVDSEEWPMDTLNDRMQQAMAARKVRIQKIQSNLAAGDFIFTLNGSVHKVVKILDNGRIIAADNNTEYSELKNEVKDPSFTPNSTFKYAPKTFCWIQSFNFSK